jgi:hypothetical protein
MTIAMQEYTFKLQIQVLFVTYIFNTFEDDKLTQ